MSHLPQRDTLLFMEKTLFSVTGMSCAACSAHVEKAVRQLEGVQKADVSLLTNRLEVQYDPSTVDTARIMQAVEKAGFGIAPLKAAAAGSDGGKEPAVQDTAAENALREKKRFLASLWFLVPLMYVSMGSMIGVPLPAFLRLSAENALSFALTQLLLTIPVLSINRHFFSNGFAMLLNRAPNMNSLIALGSGSAVVYGVFALYRISYGLGHGDMQLVNRYMHDLYFESAAMIVTLISLGKFLEARAKRKTSQALTKLIQLRPKTAQVMQNGVETEIPVDSIVKGDIVVIRPGQTIPVDGIIIEGSSSLDESAVTGESIPVEKTAGDTVISASLNLSGSFLFRAEKVGDDTTLAQIITMVEEAAASKAPAARRADTISSYFVPSVIGIALVTFAVWLTAGAGFEFALSSAISVLVISCPCALGLATPAAIMAGTGRAAQLGILIKSAAGLETAERTQAVLLDKTGTITEGAPVLQKITSFLPAASSDGILHIAYSLEVLSEHPLARAVLHAAKEKQLEAVAVNGFTAKHGKGIFGYTAEPFLLCETEAPLPAKTLLAAGNVKLFEELGIPLSAEVHAAVAACAENGHSPLLIGTDGMCAGLISVSDPVKEGSIRAVAAFHNMGLRTVMLTGDAVKTAEAIRQEVGVQEVFAELLPQDKKAAVEKYRKQGLFTAFIGDGVNDALALTAADTGIAIGCGTDIAVESADIVLMNNNLETVVTALQLSKAVVRTIKQNLFWALFYNSLCIPLAAGVFYTAFGIKLSPMFAAAAMSFSSVSVVTNALRLNRFKPNKTAPAQTHTASAGNADSSIMEENIMENITVLTVEGMSCEHCSATVKKALGALDGVNAAVNLETKAVTITHPESVTRETLAKAVIDAGYTVV